MTPRRDNGGRWRAAGLLAALLAVTFVAYAPALRAGFVWDDDDYVTENPLLVKSGGLVRIWTTSETPQYYPLVFTTFWLEHRLWGFAPAGYHAVNVALHALNAWLVGVILARLRVRGAWFVALVFALHPVHVESVAWVTERKNVLSGLCYLGAVLAWCRFDRTRRARDYALTALLFVAALLSKTVTATLPLALALLHLWRDGRLERRVWTRLLPLLAVGPLLALITVRLESGMVDRVAGDFGFSWVERFAIAGRALLFYPAKLLAPWPLSFNYPRWPIEGAGLAALWPWLVVTSIGGALWVAWRRGRRGPACAAGFFAVTIAPALGFLDVYPFRYSFVADHFQYLASLGVIVAAVGGVLAVAAGRVKPIATRTAGAALALGLAALTFSQAATYRDPETLWRATIAANPTSWLAHSNLALVLLERGDAAGALEHFDAALAAKPDAVESLTGRGLALAATGRAVAALDDLDRAVELDPGYPEARLNRARVALEAGRPAVAAADLDVFLAANPDYVPALRRRALARAALGDAAAALTDLDRALVVAPDANLYTDRGALRLRVGRLADAEADFGRAVAAEPGVAAHRVNRALARVRLGRAADALADVEAALAIDASSVEAWLLRGRLEAAAGRPGPACDALRRACDLGRCDDWRSHCDADEP